MSDPTPNEVRASVVANRAQLNADDLVAGPITVAIEKVSKGDRDQPIYISLVGYKDKTFRPCKTMRRVLIATFGDRPQDWIGVQMTLYRDPDIVFGGLRVGGIRISHLSGLDGPKTYMLTKTRGKKAEVTIQPLKPPAALTPEDQEFIAALRGKLEAAETLEELKGYAEDIKVESKAIQDALRPVYAKRQKELKDTQ